MEAVNRAEPTVDPVLRCDSCNKLVKLETLHNLGCCDSCGNKRVRNVTVLSPVEREQVEEWRFDDFLAQFEPTDE